MDTTTRTRTALALVLLLLLTACGSDDTDTSETAETAENTADTPAEVVAITAVDYAFEGVPAEVAAGTELTLQGVADAEPHEAVVFRVPDGDDRAPLELLDSGEELPFAGVLIAPPGGAPGFGPEGPVVLTEPGRYLLVCFIPVGTTAEAFAELAESGGTSEDLPQTGPPHFVQGMVADLTVAA